MIKLKAENLYKSYYTQDVLCDVSLQLNKGEVTAILGTSGSGKSTLLRCMNLLTSPDKGQIKIDDLEMDFPSIQKQYFNPQEMVRLRQKIGMVFQQFNLWTHMTLLGNLIAAPLYVLKQQKAETIIQANNLLAKVGLQDFSDYYPAQLSGGQQQRAAIARSLMMKPEIMLFDEPTSALDPEMVSEVLTVIQNLAKEGMTMLIATHEINFAKNVAESIIFLDQGKVIEQGSVQTMFNTPATQRFKNFLDAVQI